MGPDWSGKESIGFDYAINEPFCGDFVFLSKQPVFKWNEKKECLMYFSDGNYYSFESYVWVRPKIKYFLVKYLNGVSGLYFEKVCEFTSIECAISFHKRKELENDGLNTFFKIEVEYDD